MYDIMLIYICSMSEGHVPRRLSRATAKRASPAPASSLKALNAPVGPVAPRKRGRPARVLQPTATGMRICLRGTCSGLRVWVLETVLACLCVARRSCVRQALCQLALACA